MCDTYLHRRQRENDARAQSAASARSRRPIFAAMVAAVEASSAAMLRHACGFKLANEGHDTRSIQQYLGHRNIAHTVRYTELAPGRFKHFWKD